MGANRDHSPEPRRYRHLGALAELLACPRFALLDDGEHLVDNVEQAVLEHLENPTAAPVYKTTRERPLPYRWFAVGNYMVFYVVFDDVMEVRRLAYGARDLTKIVV